MPNRIIKESICTSDNIDQLSPFEENCFIRLMVNCDDFGRFDARPKILASKLFPLKSISPEEMGKALEALIKADLVTVYTVDGKPFLFMNTWERHQQRRASKSKYPDPASGNIGDHSPAPAVPVPSSDNTCNQMISDDIRFPRNRNRGIEESIIDNRDRESFMNDDEARQIQNDHNRIIDSAEDAGFKMSNDVRASLIKLYSEYGLEKMLDGFSACMKHGATNLAYLEAVLKGSPRKKTGGGRVLPAQDFEQRDYSNVDDEIMAGLIEEVRRYQKTGEVNV